MFVGTFTFAQKKYNNNTSAENLNLEGKALSGYKTAFDFGREEVRKGWWKYAREFGSPLNMKSYYKVTVPSETTDGNVDLEIFTQTTAREGGGTEFFLGLTTEKYKEQALSMILDFKKKFYIMELVSLIAKKQNEAKDLCDEYLDQVLDSKRSQLLDKINEIESEINELREEIKSIEGG